MTMLLSIDIKPFSFHLKHKLKTSQGTIESKKGWLLHIHDSLGASGWGEVSHFDKKNLFKCEKILNTLNQKVARNDLEAGIKIWPGAMSFGIGAALAEMDGIIGSNSGTKWLKAPPSAILLPANYSLLETVECLVKRHKINKDTITMKWKIGINSIHQEKDLLSKILKLIPANFRLRLDANAGLNRLQANEWANLFSKEPRLEWLEQPLPAHDIEGLSQLAKATPIALDESLVYNPSLRSSWQSWQIRRPAIDGDPRVLLNELKQGKSFLSLSTAFETGIGRRWVNHLSAMQQKGPTPTAPGLAPGWSPNNELFSDNPILVWKSA